MNLKAIMDICHFFGKQSGRWEENEFIHTELVEEQFNYITKKCKEYNFRYTINGNIIRYEAEEHNEKIISVKDIQNTNITSDNYHQFDGISCDIKEQLIKYLTENMTNKE